MSISKICWKTVAKISLSNCVDTMTFQGNWRFLTTYSPAFKHSHINDLGSSSIWTCGFLNNCWCFLQADALEKMRTIIWYSKFWIRHIQIDELPRTLVLYLCFHNPWTAEVNLLIKNHTWQGCRISSASLLISSPALMCSVKSWIIEVSTRVTSLGRQRRLASSSKLTQVEVVTLGDLSVYK